MAYDTFTARQKQIAEKILEGKTNVEICEELNLAIQTVKYHLTILYKKIGAKNRSQFIVKLFHELKSGH